MKSYEPVPIKITNFKLIKQADNQLCILMSSWELKWEEIMMAYKRYLYKVRKILKCNTGDTVANIYKKI